MIKKENVLKFMQYIEKLAKVYEFNLPNGSYDMYAFAKDLLDWLERQGEPNPYSGVSFKYNGHTWGMCARDNGVEILVDGEIKERIFLDNKPQGKQTNERAWLYLVSDVLTWKDGIGQYLDDPRVQELAKKLCSEYSQKLFLLNLMKTL